MTDEQVGCLLVLALVITIAAVTTLTVFELVRLVGWVL